MSAPHALLTSAGKPAMGFDTLRDLAHHILYLTQDPVTGDQCNGELAPVAVSVARTAADEPETRPAVSIHRLRGDLRELIGYARVGEPGRNPLVQKEQLMAAIQVLLRERADASQQRGAA